jgi:hypothetical protein
MIIFTSKPHYARNKTQIQYIGSGNSFVETAMARSFPSTYIQGTRPLDILCATCNQKTEKAPYCSNPFHLTHNLFINNGSGFDAPNVPNVPNVPNAPNVWTMSVLKYAPDFFYTAIIATIDDWTGSSTVSGY